MIFPSNLNNCQMQVFKYFLSSKERLSCMKSKCRYDKMGDAIWWDKPISHPLDLFKFKQLFNKMHLNRKSKCFYNTKVLNNTKYKYLIILHQFLGKLCHNIGRRLVKRQVLKWKIFGQIEKCICLNCKIYLFKWLNVFVHILKYICWNFVDDDPLGEIHFSGFTPFLSLWRDKCWNGRYLAKLQNIFV